jgi:hypothetical protein
MARWPFFLLQNSTYVFCVRITNSAKLALWTGCVKSVAAVTDCLALSMASMRSGVYSIADVPCLLPRKASVSGRNSFAAAGMNRR